MSLPIDLDSVNKILLNDGWYVVMDKSFCLGTYEFQWNGETEHVVGEGEGCSTGFYFKGHKEGLRIGGGSFSGPLTSILAVNCELKPK